MKIDTNFNHMNFKNKSMEEKPADPFDLNLEVTELKLQNNVGVPSVGYYCPTSLLACPTRFCR